MKIGLSRPEKVAKLKTLAVECDQKQRARVPLNPRPRPTTPDAAARETAKELRVHARSGLVNLTSAAGAALPRNVREEGYRHIIELCSDSLAADATFSYAITHRATAHAELHMWEECAADAAWAEQLIREQDGPLDVGSLVTALFYSGKAKLRLGRFEESLDDLQLALSLDPEDSSCSDQMASVRRRMAPYEAGANARRERAQRIEDYDAYGLSPYELALLDDAGIPPWAGYAKHILGIVNGVEKDVAATKSRNHYTHTQCGNCFKNKFEARLSLCARCKAAMYCSKECQRKAWKSHKPTCQDTEACRATLGERTLEPALNCNVPDQPTNAAPLLDALNAWTDKHRPMLANTLVCSLRLRTNPHAHRTKGLRVLLEWVPGSQAAGRRFRMVSAALLEFDSEEFEEGHGSKNARQKTEDSGVGQGEEIAMMTIVCVSCVPTQYIYSPVIVGRLGGIDMPAKYWIDTLAVVIG